MKATLITLGALTIIFMISQAYISKSTDETEQYKYEVLQQLEELEIRKYESANFSYVTMEGTTYKETSGQGFRMLAGYIFGGNESNEKIAMTSPVAMSMDDSTTMMFMVPSSYKLEDLPKPNNTSVKFKVEPEKYMAAIRFGGWANDKKIAEHQEELIRLLEKHNIKHFGNFSFFGYNPPYQVANRRNEVIVEIDKNTLNGI